MGEHAQHVATRAAGWGEVAIRADAPVGCSAFRGWCFDQPVLEALISVFGGDGIQSINMKISL